ncbi:hypothetical protein ABE438_11965 [Bosea sp. TWI1241]|jgi:hypothetical protein|uniref:hypothetical protein n=1 Tax=Bosea sp. TWI1241 TaxID=3148904 RepID=UPI003209A7E1
MNKVVREHYPVEKLPADLRAEMEGVSTVTVTIDAEPEPQAGEDRRGKASWPELLERLRTLRASGEIEPVTSEEAVARIRALRDEWD